MTAEHGAYVPSSARAQPAQEGARTLRPSRSFHRPRTADPEGTPSMPAPPQTSTSLSRSGTRRRPVTEEPPLPSPSMNAPALDRMKSTRTAQSRRPSVERQQESASAFASPRTHTSSGHASTAASPPSAFSQPGKASGAQMWQQRVFIGNMQRFVLVEIGPGTSAGDVLNIVDGQGALDHGAGSGGWMLWEVSQDFGMGKPFAAIRVLYEDWETDLLLGVLQSARSGTSRR